MAHNQGGPYPVEDAVVMAFRHTSGVLGTGAWHFNAHESLDRVEITGTEGTITFSTFGDSPVQLHTSGESESFSIVNPKAIQQPLIQTIVNQLEGRGRCPSIGETGARTNWVMDQALRVYYEAI
jgi:predicted dehydrogenase